MREIKFRGLDKQYNVWRSGSLVEYDNGQSAIVFSAEGYGRGVFTNEVIPETVGQYTGLKDRDGVEIYEGDRLKRIGDNGDGIFVIKWNEQSGGFNLNYIYFDEIYDLEEFWFDSEVIGNIHDNPELEWEDNDQ